MCNTGISGCSFRWYLNRIVSMPWMMMGLILHLRRCERRTSSAVIWDCLECHLVHWYTCSNVSLDRLQRRQIGGRSQDRRFLTKFVGHWRCIILVLPIRDIGFVLARVTSIPVYSVISKSIPCISREYFICFSLDLPLRYRLICLAMSPTMRLPKMRLPMR